MQVRALAVAAVLAVAAAVVALVRRDRRLRRQLARERVEHRLTDGLLIRDLDAFRTRVEQLAAQQAVAEEAALVLDAALDRSHPRPRIDPPTEGGPR